MKIKKVKWKTHPILGDLELDFINTTTGKPFDTILFAGENGTGKTTILETISTFLNRGSFEHFECIEYIIDDKTYTAKPAQDSIMPDFFDITNDIGEISKIRSNHSNNPSLIEENNLDIRHYGCIFSKARADYKTKQITSTTTKELDTEKYDNDREDDFTSLKQLIVDVVNQDNAEYSETNQQLGLNPQTWENFFQTSKIYRFKSAFDNFFDTLKYDKVSNETSEKKILFTKNSKSISIDSLSTGEKQIVFRGIYLLKNNKKFDGAAIMIDEPELSMHPKWQQKILKYCKDLFTESQIQKVQLFLATHSEHVLKEALADKDKNLVIVLNDSNGVIKPKRIDAPNVLPSITSAETNYLAFDIVSNDYHIELYGYLQYKHGGLSVRECDNYIKAQSSYDMSIHYKSSPSLGNNPYDTLSTCIRNLIDHPDPTRNFTEAELRISIELLIELCK